jgi:hypothetical protein
MLTERQEDIVLFMIELFNKVSFLKKAKITKEELKELRAAITESRDEKRMEHYR